MSFTWPRKKLIDTKKREKKKRNLKTSAGVVLNLFEKGSSCIITNGGGEVHHGDFTCFHFHKKVNSPPLPEEGRGRGVSNDWCITE